MLIHSYLFVTALFASLIAVPGLRKWAFDTGTLDLADERKIHTEKMPRLGGVAIFLAFVFSLLMFIDLTPMIRGLLAGALVLFVTGLADDLSGLTPKRKFLGEIAGTLVAMSVSGLHITYLGNLFGFGDIVLPLWLSLPFTLFAVVGVINAINLLDGLDGLTGGVAVIALGGMALLAMLHGNSDVSLLCAALLGAIFGFLKYNSYPARIFMGDVGSLVIGFLLAFLSIWLTQGPQVRVPAILPLLLLGVPIIDTIWVMSARVLMGCSPFVADKTHVHHKFMELGFSHRITVLMIYAISIFWALVAILLRDQPAWVLLLLLLLVTTLGYQVIRFVASHCERFVPLLIDAPQRLMSVPLYQQLAGKGRYLVWVLAALLLAMLLLAIAAGCCVDEMSLRFNLLAFATGGGLLYLTRDTRNPFFQLYLFVVGLLLVYEINQVGANLLFAGFTLAEMTKLLFLIMAPLVAFRTLFQEQARPLLLTPLDLLVLSLCGSLAIISSQFALLFPLPGLLGQAVLLFLTIKILMSRGVVVSRSLCGSVLASLLVMVVHGL